MAAALVHMLALLLHVAQHVQTCAVDCRQRRLLCLALATVLPVQPADIASMHGAEHLLLHL